jgi:hypothetical protein
MFTTPRTKTPPSFVHALLVIIVAGNRLAEGKSG